MVKVPEQYIQMCRMAPELKEHEPQEGDLYALPNRITFVVSSYCFKVKDGQRQIYLAIPSDVNLASILDKPDFTSPLYSNFKKRKFELYPMKYWIWLPSQAQLQEKIPDEKNYKGEKVKHRPSYLTGKLIHFNFIHNRDYKLQFDSMEQIWLAILMKEKYFKIWNPKTNQWIKANSPIIYPPPQIFP